MTNQNTVLIIGSGRSGRGMLGELYHKAGFHIVFADNDPSLVNGLRAVGHYSVEMTDLKSGAKEESVITDFAVLNTVADHAAYIEQLATSRWISTALMPAAFDRVMEDFPWNKRTAVHHAWRKLCRYGNLLHTEATHVAR